MKRLVLILLIILVPTVILGQDNNPPSTILERLERFEKATLERNAEALSASLHKEFMLIAPTGMSISKDMFLTPFQNTNRKSDLTAIESIVAELKIIDDTAILLVNTAHQFSEASGKPDANYHMTYVLKKEGTNWLIVLSQGIRM